MTQQTVATKYAQETNGATLRFEHGPFLINPSLPLPERYVLTKTHCTGYCTFCSQSGSLVSPSKFAERCHPGSKLPTASRREPVHRAIHLIRDPFDNLVARMHLATKTGRVESLDHTREGLLTWSSQLQEKWGTTRKAALEADVFELMEQVPCGSDWFRYVQWHNNALEMIESQGLETLVLYYEDYTEHFNATVDSILSFLEQRTENPPIEFIPGKRYRGLFTKDEIQSARRLVHRLASPSLWQLLRHYFDE